MNGKMFWEGQNVPVVFKLGTGELGTISLPSGQNIVIHTTKIKVMFDQLHIEGFTCFADDIHKQQWKSVNLQIFNIESESEK